MFLHDHHFGQSPFTRSLHAIVTFTFDRYILDLHEIEDLQLECAALRLAIKERRTAHISANNVRHVVAAVKQALWYCLAISVLALAGIVGVAMLVAS